MDLPNISFEEEAYRLDPYLDMQRGIVLKILEVRLAKVFR